MRLVRLGDTGGATRRTAAPGRVRRAEASLLRRLGDDEHGRLVAVGEDSAEIAHEALITQWPWLQGRLKDDARDVRRLDRLMSRSTNGPKRRRRGKIPISLGAERELSASWLDNALIGCLLTRRLSSQHRSRQSERTTSGRNVTGQRCAVESSTMLYATVALTGVTVALIGALVRGRRLRRPRNASETRSRQRARRSR